jgi:xylose isomerase
MDWQHLLMNGEHLPEYAALLAAEGLLGHQHANSGWGIFDDDNMVGATAFMETVELALELRRADYGPTASASASTCSRTPRTRSRPSSARSSSGTSSTRSAQRIDGDALRAAQARKDAVAPTSSSTPRWARPHARV